MSFTLLLPLTLTQATTFHHAALWLYSGYFLIGSFILAFTIFIITIMISKLIGKQKQNQFVLFISAVIFTIGIAQKTPSANRSDFIYSWGFYEKLR